MYKYNPLEYVTLQANATKQTLKKICTNYHYFSNRCGRIRYEMRKQEMHGTF